MIKPFRGELCNWSKRVIVPVTKEHLGYYITGMFDGHPAFDGHFGHTSMIVSHNTETGEVETLNSRYLCLPQNEAA